MEEDLTKAYQSAEFLVSELRDAHRRLCVDHPTPADILADAFLMKLIGDACEIKNALSEFKP